MGFLGSYQHLCQSKTPVYRYLRKLCLIAEKVECTDAVLCIIIVVVHDEAISVRMSER